MDGNIRLLQDSDLDEVANLFTKVFNSEPWSEPWNFETSYKRLLDISKTPGYIGIGYFNQNNQLIGFLVGNEEQWADSKRFYINEICVLTNIQQKGIGTSLLNYLKRILIERKIDGAYLSTEKGERKPESFFEKNGYITNKSRIYMSMKISY